MNRERGDVFRDTLLRMSPTKLRKYTIWMEPKLIAALRKISKKTRIPASVLAREGIEAVVQKHQKK